MAEMGGCDCQEGFRAVCFGGRTGSHRAIAIPGGAAKVSGAQYFALHPRLRAQEAAQFVEGQDFQPSKAEAAEVFALLH